MIDRNTLEEKLNQLNQIKRLCDAKQAGIRFDQVDSNNICLIFFLLVGSLIVWVTRFPYSISGVVVAAFIFSFIIYTRSKEGEMREMIIEKYKGDA